MSIHNLLKMPDKNSSKFLKVKVEKLLMIPADENSLSLSEQQQLLRSVSTSSSIETYRKITFGTASWPKFILFELYQLLLTNLGGALGLILRRKALPIFFKRLGRGLVCGRWVSIRQPERIEIGDNVFIDDGAVLDIRLKKSDMGKIILGNSVVLGRNTIVVAKDGAIQLHDGVNVSSNCRIATESKISIGKSTLVAAYCYIGPGNHQSGNNDVPLIEREMENRGGVSIGAHVWIGAHTTILDGVEIGDGAIIGAHSLVRDNIPPRTVAVGTPAKVIREI